MIQHVLGKEKSIGRDMGKMIPRCMMASKFISPSDPTGEVSLKHWVIQGQIQDSLYLFVARL